MLIDAKANINLRNKNGMTPLFVASWKTNKDSTENTVKMLIDAKANINIQNYLEQTPLYIVSWKSDSKSTDNTVKILIDAKANINLPEKNQQTPLLFAIWRLGKESMENTVKILMDAKADLDIKNNSGFIPLLTTSNPKIFKMLVDAKADIMVEHNGKTVLDRMCDLCMQNTDTDLIERLLEQGVKFNNQILYKYKCELYEKRMEDQKNFIRAYKEGLSDTACLVNTYL